MTSTSPASGASFNHCVIILNRRGTEMKARYMPIDSRLRLVQPRVLTVAWPRLKGRMHYRAVVLNNCIYLTGGVDEQTEVVLSEVVKYDPLKNRWTECCPMKQPRFNHTASVADGKIYVAGGVLASGKPTQSCECFDAEKDEWTTVKPLLAACQDHTAIGGATQTELYLSGGCSVQAEPGTSNFWAWKQHWYGSDFEYRWEELDTEDEPAVRVPHQLEQHTMTLCNGTIYFMGGIRTGLSCDGRTFCPKPEVVCYDEDDNALTPVALVAPSDDVLAYRLGQTDEGTENTSSWVEGCVKMKQPRCQAASINIGNKIYLMGGHSADGDECIRMVEYYHTKDNSWHDAFPILDGDLYSVDCCVLDIPTTNRDFRFEPMLSTGKWIMW